MGWDAEQAEDAYWDARARGLTDRDIMAMDDGYDVTALNPSAEDEDEGDGLPDEWSEAAHTTLTEDEDEDDEWWHTRHNTPHDPLTGDPYDTDQVTIQADSLVDTYRTQAAGRGDTLAEDPHSGGYPGWTPTAQQLWDLLAKAGNPVAQMKIMKDKIVATTTPKEGPNMYLTREDRYASARSETLRAFNEAHGRRADAIPQTKDELMAMMAWAARRMAELEMDPKEPELDEDGPVVVSWEMTVNGSGPYSYAAIRVPSGSKAGQWATTGPTSPSYLTWEGLVAWIKKSNGGTLPALRVVEEWHYFHRTNR